MSWSRHCCRLRPPATTLVIRNTRPSHIPPSHIHRAFFQSSTSSGNSPSPQKPALSQESQSSKELPNLQKSPATQEPPVSEDADSPPPPINTTILDGLEQQEALLKRDLAVRKLQEGPKAPQKSRILAERQEKNMAQVLDPKPRLRKAFQRRMVMREVKNRGQLSKEQYLKRTERMFVNQSAFEKTGMKKVAPLARQIAGKKLDDAIVQMQFSKKRAAKWIRAHLIATRNRAIIERGMALGRSKATIDARKQAEAELDAEAKLAAEKKLNAIANLTPEARAQAEAELFAKDAERTKTSPAADGVVDQENTELFNQKAKKEMSRKKKLEILTRKEREILEEKDGPERELKILEKNLPDPVTIRLKDGSRHNISDPTELYIDQAWVNKGPYGQAFTKRGRHQFHQLRLPQTAITIQLKEERTRAREYDERKEREERKKVWMQLPNKPISTQRPYYTW